MNNQSLENIKKPSNKDLKEKVMKVVLFSNSIDDAMAVLRILGPANSAGMKVIRGAAGGVVNLDLIGEGDIVVIQRDFPRNLDAYEKTISICRAAHKTVVFDLDDLLFELPDNHPDRIRRYFSDSLLPMLQAVMEADLVTVATTPLRDYLLNYNQNIELFPNYLNDSIWSLKEPSSKPSPSVTLTIGYMGGLSHQPDLIAIKPVLENIIKKYPQQLKLHFWGIEPPPELAPYSTVDWCPPKSYAYDEFAAFFQTQSADIMLAPLLDTEFNRCKSCIKYLEYSALGVPGIYSKVTPYDRVIENGVNGLLASSLLEWEQSLSQLIENPDLRKEIALNAQQDIRRNWLLSSNAQQLREIYDNAVNKHVDQARRLPLIYSTLKTLTRQVYENNQIKNQQLSENKNQIEIQNEQIRLLTTRVNEDEEEILSYILSASWQITRPLRKISGKFIKGNH